MYLKIHATELQSCYLQFEHIPFTTILIVSSLKLTGKVIVGINVSFKQ